ncbi:MAG: sodium/solute symporter [Verrucomicrobiota bacterium]
MILVSRKTPFGFIALLYLFFGTVPSFAVDEEDSLRLSQWPGGLPGVESSSDTVVPSGERYWIFSSSDSPADSLTIRKVSGEKILQKEDFWQGSGNPIGIPYEDGVILLDSGDGDSQSRPLYLALDEEDVLVERVLPQLPEVFESPVAQVQGDDLYVFGKVIDDSESAQMELFRLGLEEADSSWQELEPFPGFLEEKPLFLTHDDMLLVFGKSGEGVYQAWSYTIKPIDGTTHRGWKDLGSVPFDPTGALVYFSGQAHLIALGGEQNDDGSTPVYAYHTVTNTWVEKGDLPAGVTPLVLIPLADQIVLLGEDEAGEEVFWEIQLESKIKKLSFADYSVMIVYFILMAGIGVYFAKKQNTSEEFALGNRRVKWWAAGISMFATGASSISFMAIPALTFRSNLVWFFPVLFLIPIFFLQAYIIYPLLRNLSLTSTYEYLERRYHPALRYLASLQCIAFQVVGRMSIVLLLPALAISAVTGLDVGLSVLMMGVMTTIYTAVGGFEAVIWTDVCQGILMLFGALLISAIAIGSLPGGVGDFVAVNQEFNRFQYAIFSFDYTVPIISISIFALLMQQLGFVADQPSIQRVFATPEKEMKKLAGMAVFCGIAIAAAVNLVGLSIFAYFHSFPETLDPTMSNDQVVPLFIVQSLPVGIAGLIVAALFAASMSTLSSSMNSVATLISEDFYRRIKRDSSDRSRLILMKVSSLVVGVIGTGIAFYMAQMDLTSIFKTWNEAVALLGGGFVGIYIVGMFTKRVHSGGAFIGAIASIAIVIYAKNMTAFHWVFYVPIAVVSCMVVGYLVSMILPRDPSKDLTGLTVFSRK